MIGLEGRTLQSKHYLETYTMFFEELGKEMTCLSYVR